MPAVTVAKISSEIEESLRGVRNGNNNNNNHSNMPTSTNLPQIFSKNNSDDFQSSAMTLTKRRQNHLNSQHNHQQLQQQQQQQQQQPGNNVHDQLHLKPINLELSGVTAVKIVNSKQRTDSPPFLLTSITTTDAKRSGGGDKKTLLVDLDGRGLGSKNSSSPVDNNINNNMFFLPSSMNKSQQQDSSWAAGAFPTRLKPVRVRRPIDSRTSPTMLAQQQHSPISDQVRPLEPKLFDFSIGLDTMNLTDSNEDIEDYNPPALAGMRLDDDLDNATLVSRPQAKPHYDILEVAKEAEISKKSSEVTTVTKLPPAITTNDRIGQQHYSSGVQSLKIFPPVTAAAVVPPLGHSTRETQSSVGLPRLPPLTQPLQSLPQIMKMEGKARQRVTSANSKAKDRSSDFGDVTLIGTKALSNGSNNEGMRDNRNNKLLSLSSTSAELGTAFRQELGRGREKKSISPIFP